ncbi:MAG: prepilin peptidase [Pseudomonadota bacterium]|nr:prepilin peptidase [Pseudomonadota bacterium]
MTWWMDVLIAAFGGAVGSFLNVCIHRLPAGGSLLAPPSSCPACGHAIRVYDNIPLLSYALLKGRCRDCGASISRRYPLVEGASAILALFLFWKYGFSWQFPAAFAFVSALLVITFIDLDHQIIPDVVTLPGIPLGLILAVTVMGLPFMEALWGLLIGGGLLYLVAVAYAFIRKMEGMGGGDIKLLAMIGAFLGWKSLPFIVLVSALAAGAVGVALMVAKGRDMKYALPFGPFLSLAAVAYILGGGELFLRLLLQR